jgi:hypothetical protein
MKKKMVYMLPLLNNDEDGAKIKPWFSTIRMRNTALEWVECGEFLLGHCEK